MLGDKGKNLAKCEKCLQALTNTSIIRMAKHRKKCGMVLNINPVTLVKDENILKQNEINKVHIIESVSYSNEDQNAVKAIYWTTTEEQCEVDDQQHVLQVEKVDQPTNIEMIQEEINTSSNRHHENHKKSSSSKKFRNGNLRPSNSNFLDATLSRFIIGCNLSFDVIDSSHFKRFANAMNPNCK